MSRWLCGGLAVQLDAGSWVRSSEDNFSGRGDFSIGVNMGSDSISPKTLSEESFNRGLVCAHMHSMARTQMILTFMSKTGEYRQQKYTQHAPSTKTECDYLNDWIKKNGPICKNLTQRVNPSRAGMTWPGKREDNPLISCSQGRGLMFDCWLLNIPATCKCISGMEDLYIGCLLNVPATCECISGTDLLRQFYMLPHWDRSCRSNFPSHPVTVCWHQADQSQHWSYNARCLAG